MNSKEKAFIVVYALTVIATVIIMYIIRTL